MATGRRRGEREKALGRAWVERSGWVCGRTGEEKEESGVSGRMGRRRDAKLGRARPNPACVREKGEVGVVSVSPWPSPI
ncbi:hypothetical protein NL676_031972 [Syzygium grande]|nr:hypothetical protein NL676_031972 [Syzygium grande]